MKQTEAASAAHEFMAHYAIGVRELAEWLGVGKTIAGELADGNGSGPAILRLQRNLERVVDPPIDSWTDGDRERLRAVLASSWTQSEFEHATAVTLETARRAAQDGSRPSRPVRRLLKQFSPAVGVRRG